MSTISGQYSTAPLYSLFQAGQSSSVAGSNNPQNTTQTGSQNDFVSNLTSQIQSNAGAAPQSGSLEDSPTDLNALQANSGKGTDATTDATDTASQLPVSTTYSAPAPDETDPNGSFINNQEASADYQSMVLNLGQGNLAAAAKDYAQLQTDLKLHGQHHSGGTVAVEMNSSVDSAAGSVLNVTV